MPRRVPAWRLLLPLCALLALPSMPLPAGAADRAALLAERDRLEARFAEEQARCSERFAVTACVDDVRRRRREALAATRAQLLDLDDAERRQRAEERRRTVQDKQRRAAERPAAASGEAAASGPRPHASAPAPRPVPAVEDDREAARQQAAAEAARRAQAAQRRRAEIEARQAGIARRQAERSGKPADPLPIPAPLSSAPAGR